MILHVTTPQAWKAAIAEGVYRPPSLAQEGFIHCCLEQQLPGVLQRYYPNAGELVVLYIEEENLKEPVLWEPSPAVQELFPHIYGAINLDAVQTIKSLVR